VGSRRRHGLESLGVVNGGELADAEDLDGAFADACCDDGDTGLQVVRTPARLVELAPTAV